MLRRARLHGPLGANSLKSLRPDKARRNGAVLNNQRRQPPKLRNISVWPGGGGTAALRRCSRWRRRVPRRRHGTPETGDARRRRRRHADAWPRVTRADGLRSSASRHHNRRRARASRRASTEGAAHSTRIVTFRRAAEPRRDTAAHKTCGRADSALPPLERPGIAFAAPGPEAPRPYAKHLACTSSAVAAGTGSGGGAKGFASMSTRPVQAVAAVWG